MARPTSRAFDSLWQAFAPPTLKPLDHSSSLFIGSAFFVGQAGMCRCSLRLRAWICGFKTSRQPHIPPSGDSGAASSELRDLHFRPSIFLLIPHFTGDRYSGPCATSR